MVILDQSEKSLCGSAQNQCQYVMRPAPHPLLKSWQHQNAVTQGYGNDKGFTNVDAAYITAAQDFKNRLLSDCAGLERPPEKHQRAHMQESTSCVQRPVSSTPLLFSVILWYPLHLTCCKPFRVLMEMTTRDKCQNMSAFSCMEVKVVSLMKYNVLMFQRLSGDQGGQFPAEA